MTQPEKDDESIYYQDTKEGKEWADWAYKTYLFYTCPSWAGSMEHYDDVTLEENR